MPRLRLIGLTCRETQDPFRDEPHLEARIDGSVGWARIGPTFSMTKYQSRDLRTLFDLIPFTTEIVIRVVDSDAGAERRWGGADDVISAARINPSTEGQGEQTARFQGQTGQYTLTYIVFADAPAAGPDPITVYSTLHLDRLDCIDAYEPGHDEPYIVVNDVCVWGPEKLGSGEGLDPDTAPIPFYTRFRIELRDGGWWKRELEGFYHHGPGLSPISFYKRDFWWNAEYRLDFRVVGPS